MICSRLWLQFFHFVKTLILLCSWNFQVLLFQTNKKRKRKKCLFFSHSISNYISAEHQSASKRKDSTCKTERQPQGFAKRNFFCCQKKKKNFFVQRMKKFFFCPQNVSFFGDVVSTGLNTKQWSEYYFRSFLAEMFCS